MTLAIFDLDNTLINGDSDHAWGNFVVEIGLVNSTSYQQENEHFYQQYLAGTLDIFAYQAFVLRPLINLNAQQLQQLQQSFFNQKILPMMQPKAIELLSYHRDKNHFLLMITATNRFIAQPTFDYLDMHDLIATEPEFNKQQITGRIIGTPSYQQGKVERLMSWIKNKQFDLSQSFAYSDSFNDLPLLNSVGFPCAVNADDHLTQRAQEYGWQSIDLRP